jgi:hypothetical protein
MHTFAAKLMQARDDLDELPPPLLVVTLCPGSVHDRDEEPSKGGFGGATQHSATTVMGGEHDGTS